MILYVNGAVPVNCMLRFVLCPLQIAVVPLIIAVGREFTLIVAVPVISPVLAVQLASVREVTELPVVEAGDTETVSGLLVATTEVPLLML